MMAPDEWVWRERSERIRFWLRIDRQAVQKWRKAQARYRASIGTPAEWQAWQDLLVARRLRSWASERAIRSWRQ